MAMLALMGALGLNVSQSRLSNPEVPNSLTIHNRPLRHKNSRRHVHIALMACRSFCLHISIYWIFRGKVKLDKNELLNPKLNHERGVLESTLRCRPR